MGVPLTIVLHIAAEIESYHATLNEALAEVKRMRVAEEARLAERVAAVHEAFGTRLAELQAEYRRNVGMASHMLYLT